MAHLVTRMHREKLFNERAWTVRARARLVDTRIPCVGIATNPHTPGIIVLPLSERVFFTANERVFGALITSAFYIIHGMEEDRG